MNEAPIYTGNGATDPAERQRREMIATLEADRRAIAAKRAERQAKNDADSELTEAKIALENELAIDNAEAEHGPLEGSVKIAAIYTATGRVVIVKRPHRALFHRFQDGGKATSKRVHELVSPHLVHPTSADFDSWLNEEPALLGRAAHQLAILAGIREEEIQGK